MNGAFMFCKNTHKPIVTKFNSPPTCCFVLNGRVTSSGIKPRDYKEWKVKRRIWVINNYEQNLTLATIP